VEALSGEGTSELALHIKTWLGDTLLNGRENRSRFD